VAVPRFSVILPTYNRSAAIRPTIASVLAQTERDWELLVVSDACSDDTEAIVESYADPRVRLLRLPERAGHPGPPRNAGLAHARGELVAYLDHDDRWRPGHLAELASLLGESRVAASGGVPVDAAGRATGPPTGVVDATWSPELQVLAPIFEPSRVGHRRGVVEAVGGWAAGPAGLEDWDLWLRLADAGERFVTSTRPTAELMQHRGSRRHALPVAFELVLGRLPSPGHARAALEALAAPPLRRRLRELHLAAAARWYRSLAEAGTLVEPAGAPPRPDWRSELAAALPEDTLAGLVGARADGNGGAVIARPLPCVSAGHAERVEAILREHFEAKLAFVRRTLRAVARGPAA
jgi:glycosyltransferase involved in cell wall biosynthesis